MDRTRLLQGSNGVVTLLHSTMKSGPLTPTFDWIQRMHTETPWGLNILDSDYRWETYMGTVQSMSRKNIFLWASPYLQAPKAPYCPLVSSLVLRLATYNGGKNMRQLPSLMAVNWIISSEIFIFSLDFPTNLQKQLTKIYVLIFLLIIIVLVLSNKPQSGYTTPANNSFGKRV